MVFSRRPAKIPPMAARARIKAPVSRLPSQIRSPNSRPSPSPRPNSSRTAAVAANVAAATAPMPTNRTAMMTLRIRARTKSARSPDKRRSILAARQTATTATTNDPARIAHPRAAAPSSARYRRYRWAVCRRLSEAKPLPGSFQDGQSMHTERSGMPSPRFWRAGRAGDLAPTYSTSERTAPPRINPTPAATRTACSGRWRTWLSTVRSICRAR